MKMEDNKNYVFYDESYLAPGYFIINKNDRGEVEKFIKIYSKSENGFPEFAIRGYKKGLDEDCKPGIMVLEFRDKEEDATFLYELLTDLCYEIDDKKIYSVDRALHNDNNMYLTNDGRVTRIIMIKDFLTPSDYFDLIIGDDYTCENFDAFLKLYNKLNLCVTKKISDEEIRKLILSREEKI